MSTNISGTSTPTTKLSVAEVTAAELAGWHQLGATLTSRWQTGDFATGLAFVDRVGGAAEEAGHHPDIHLSYPEVRIELSSHDVGGITSRDIDLARTITALADEAGISASDAITRVELALDQADPTPVGPFYAALFGAEWSDDTVVDPSGQAPEIWFQGPDEGGAELPPADPPQRWHADVWVSPSTAEARVQAVLDAGGTLVSDAEAPSYWVLEDAAGNRHCICSASAR